MQTLYVVYYASAGTESWLSMGSGPIMSSAQESYLLISIIWASRCRYTSDTCFDRPALGVLLNLAPGRPPFGGLHVAASATWGRARTTGGTSAYRGRRSLTALRKRGARREYSLSAHATARARGFLACPALLTKQFKLKVAVRTKIFIDRHR